MLSELKIATITATGFIGNKNVINLENFFNDINIVQDGEGVFFVNYNGKIKGTPLKKPKKKRHNVHSNRHKFENQLTLGIRKEFDESELLEEEKVLVKKDIHFLNQNVKVFPNGMLQMTGLRHVNQGIWVLYFVSALLNIHDPPKDYQIHMINSDFKLGRPLDFDVLQDRLRDNNLYFSYEPVSYHGLKVSFFYNHHKDGICHCDPKCKSKVRHKATHEGKQQSELICKKVTISFFTSGAVIITGGNKIEHITTCYKKALALCKED